MKNKEKKPNFLDKLKEKIDQLVNDDSLTIVGKILMLAIYGIVWSIKVMAPLAIITGVLNTILVACKVSTTVSLGGIIGVLTFLIFVCAFYIFAVTAIELYFNIEYKKSVLKIDKKED